MFHFFLPKKSTCSVAVASLLMLGLTHSSNAAVPIEQGSLTRNNTAIVSSNAATLDSQGSTLWQLYQQVQQLQQEVRQLRGQLEAQQNGLERTQKELKNRYTDLDQRLELLREQSEPADSDTPSEAIDENNSNDNADQDEDVPADPSPTSAPATRSSNNLYVQSGSTSIDSDKADEQAYIGAYDAYKVGGATKAIKPMQQFIVNFPNSVYVPNAYYWLGEFYLATNPADFEKAKKSFNEVVSKYPKSAKASTSLYRLATISQEIDKRTPEALNLMKKLSRDYPNSTEAQYAKSFIATHP
ncbi:tetratricopeptide repeat protein [Alkanindiges sp. WGS2144]|uniref:tetratricopeptide repeat protein n=1 Tax=Alkanindiges sp. WGS2144 TaxID=3366808 RepID=UPI0037535DF5